MALMSRLSTPDRAGRGAGDESLVNEFRRKLLEEVDLQELQRLDATQRRARLERVMGILVSREGPVMSNRARSDLVRQVVNEALGLGVLEPLLADPSVTEIMVTGIDQVYVERFGRVEKVGARFTSEAQLLQTIDRIVAGVNRRVDESSPMADARLPTGERVNVVLPPLAVDGPQLTIRRFPRPFTVEELIQRGTLTRELADLLAACVRARLNVIVSGGTGSGKTTLLNTLSGYLGETERIVTIEDAAELRLEQEHVVRLESRPPNIEGVGEVTIRDLVRNALRMRPDRIIVGEVRGGETMDMLQAMNTGHDGSLATVHANSVAEAMTRLETLASMSDLQIPYAALRDQINSAIDVVVQLERGMDGGRRVTAVGVVASRHREDVRVENVATFVTTRVDPVAGVAGYYEYAELPEHLRERIRLRNVVTPDRFLPSGPAR